jgi:hypothetical protein
MNWNLLLALAPVLAKYGPGLIALYQADEPLAAQLIADLKPVFVAPSLATILPVITKWGPQLVTLAQQQGAQIQQFIADVEAALNAAGGVAVAAGGGQSIQNVLAGLPIPITVPAPTFPSPATTTKFTS